MLSLLLKLLMKIDKKQEIIDTDFIDLKSKFDKVNDVISEQKTEKEVEHTIENIFDTNNFDDFWWEEDLFDKKIQQPWSLLLKKY